jgi:hypothetical protein
MKLNYMMLRFGLVAAITCFWADTAGAYYDPGVQKWLNRDPIGERASIDLYSFVENDPTESMDFFGLQKGGARPPNYGWPVNNPPYNVPPGPAGDPHNFDDIFTPGVKQIANWTIDAIEGIYNLFHKPPVQEPPKAPPETGCSNCPANLPPIYIRPPPSPPSWTPPALLNPPCLCPPCLWSR